MKSVATFLHVESCGCGFLIVWLVGRIQSSAVHAKYAIRTSHEVLFCCCPSGTARILEDIMHQAMMFLDIHFMVAYCRL